MKSSNPDFLITYQKNFIASRKTQMSLSHAVKNILQNIKKEFDLCVNPHKINTSHKKYLFGR